MNRLLLILAIASVSIEAMGTVYCIGPSATGNGSGTDWNNIKAWSSTPARGDTWYLEGGTYSGKIFSVPASGATLITITKATTLSHVTDTGWNNSIMSTQAVFNTTSSPDGTRAAFMFETSYWLVDGVNPQNTNWDMNPLDYGFKITDTSCWGIDLCGTTTTTNFTIAHFAAKGVSGTSDPGTTCASVGSLDDFVECYYGHAYEVDGVTVSNCLLDGWEASVCFPVGSQSINWLIQGNVIMDNKYYNDAHCEDINENPCNCQDITIRNNLFYNAQGVTGCIVPALNGSSDGPWYIYGNVFYKNLGDGSGGTGANGIIGTGSGGVYAHGVYIFNNTFDDNNDIWLNNLDAGSGSVITGAATNNLFYNQTGGTASGPPSSYGTVDYSAYYSCSGGNNGDAHPQTATGNPFVNDAAFNFELVADTTPGKNLGSPFNVDPAGNVRTGWTRGAFEFNTGSATNGSGPLEGGFPVFFSVK